MRLTLLGSHSKHHKIAMKNILSTLLIASILICSVQSHDTSKELKEVQDLQKQLVKSVTAAKTENERLRKELSVLSGAAPRLLKAEFPKTGPN